VNTEQEQNQQQDSGQQQDKAQERDPEKRLDEARTEREEAEGTEKPEVTDEHKEQAEKMGKYYKEERPTVAMPDTGGTVSGTAVSEWTDEGQEGEKPEGESGDKG